MRDNNNVPVKAVGIVIDVEEQFQKEMELKNKASRDSLTGLYNKGITQQLIENTILDRGTQNHALILFDIDDFKSVNDTFGHLYGDQLIAKIAGSIRAAVTSEETNAYRYGGDEFLMIIPDGTQEIAEDVIEKWRQVMKPIQKNSEIPVSASVGYAVGKYENIMELIEIADQRMYKDKQLRRQ